MNLGPFALHVTTLTTLTWLRRLTSKGYKISNAQNKMKPKIVATTIKHQQQEVTIRTRTHPTEPPISIRLRSLKWGGGGVFVSSCLPTCRSRFVDSLRFYQSEKSASLRSCGSGKLSDRCHLAKLLCDTGS